MACAAYRAGDKLDDERSTRVESQPIVHDYTHRRGVVHSEIILPPDAPAWAGDRAALWNAAEAAEKRKDATVAREVECGLPWELSDVHRKDLAREITRALVGRYGFAADFAVHRPVPAKGDDPRNHHVHIQCTTRVLAADGLGAKTRVLDDKKTGSGEVRWIREMVARLTNDALVRAGIDASVDHQSLVDRRAAALAEGDDEQAAALDRPATKHRGPDVEGILRGGRESEVDERITEELADEVAAIGRRQAAEAAVLADIASIDDELVSLRDEIADLEAQVAEALHEIAAAPSVVVPIRPPPPPAPDTAAVLDQVARLWAAYARADGMHDDARDSWPALRVLDRNDWTPDAPDLRVVLDKHPALRREWSAEITSREPEIAAAERAREQERRQIRKQAARAFMAPVPSPAPAPARAPTAKTEPAPVARRDLATVPAPLPAARTVRDVDEAIADAEARLQALEQRERVRAAAAEAYRRAQAALHAAQAGLWSRVRAFVGLGAGASEIEARAALKKAEQGIKSQGAAVVFGKVVLPADAGERVELKRQLVALRDERGGLVAADAATAAQTAAVVDQVVGLIKRVDLVVPAAQRAKWPALVVLDAAGGIEQLRERLTRDSPMLAALAYDLGCRRPTLEALEQAQRLPALEAPVQQVGAVSVVDSRPQGLVAVIEAGPRRAPPGHFDAYFAGSGKRGEISEEEFQLVTEVLRQLPAEPLLRDELLRLVVERIAERDQVQEPEPEQDDWPAPGA